MSLELTFKNINKAFIKSGDRASELKDGKLSFGKDGLRFNGKHVQLSKVEKERSTQYCYMRLEVESGLVIQINIFRPRKKQQEMERPSLI